MCCVYGRGLSIEAILPRSTTTITSSRGQPLFPKLLLRLEGCILWKRRNATMESMISLYHITTCKSPQGLEESLHASLHQFTSSTYLKVFCSMIQAQLISYKQSRWLHCLPRHTRRRNRSSNCTWRRQIEGAKTVQDVASKHQKRTWWTVQFSKINNV